MSETCKKSGNLVCGVCHCDESHLGKQCECKKIDIESNAVDLCRASHGSEICSGRGTCNCGVCQCTRRQNNQEEFYGDFCQCDNFSCKRSANLVCGGKGTCDCGTCNCKSGWTGEACDCKNSNSSCIAPNKLDSVCNGRGDCICGSCHCYETENARYSGQFCEECPTCSGKMCDALKDCVECKAYGSGQMWRNNSCEDCTYELEIMKVDHVEETFESNKNNSYQICQTPIDEGCTIVFAYKQSKMLTSETQKGFKIIVENKKHCPTPVNVTGVAVGVIISTLFIGFAILLLWKLVTVIQDRREFAKFENERILVKWERGDNPFYKKATTTFNNPTFKESPNS